MKLAPPPELACREVVSDYLEHALGAGAHAHVEQHFLVCPPCSAYLAQMRRSIELSAALRSGADEAEVAPSLLQAFRDRKAR
jgi:hypothetical protein